MTSPSRGNRSIAEIQNNIFTTQECSIHECGNRNEIVHKFERLEVVCCHSYFMELSKESNTSALLSFQLVVLDGRIVNFHLHTKNYDNNSNSLL